jgi:hypothetical protein
MVMHAYHIPENTLDGGEVIATRLLHESTEVPD